MSAPAELLNALQREGPRLAEQVTSELMAHPFWKERFGEGGRKHGSQDGHYHMSYLLQALAADDVGVMMRYATWLQGVLNARGMCSLHLVENFERLAAALQHQPWPGVDAAVRHLHAAAAALTPAEEPARSLALRASAMAARVAAAVRQGSEASDAVEVRRCARDVQHLVSYLSDALALGSSASLLAYVGWLRGYLVRQGRTNRYLEQMLECLAADPEVPAAGRAYVREALEESRRGAPPSASLGRAS